MSADADERMFTACARYVLSGEWDRNEWINARNNGIGGSDAATVLGLNPYCSEYELWLRKSGYESVEEQPLTPDSPMYWGNALEDDVATAFELSTGMRARPAPILLANIDRPWQLASIDRLVFTDELYAPIGLLECKTTSLWQAAEWRDDELPAPALAQATHYMSVTGLAHAWVAGLIGGQRFVVKHVERDDALIEMLNEREAEFWDRVIRGVPPDPDGSESARAAIARRYPRANDDEPAVQLDKGALQAVESIRELDKQITELSMRREQLAQDVRLKLGEHAIGADGDRHVVRWRNRTWQHFDVNAFRAEHPELADKYTQQRTARVFTVPKKD